MPENGNGLPFIHLYAGDFLTDVQEWGLHERGAHITLLCSQWVNGSLPADKKRLMRVLGCTEKEFDLIWPVVGKKYEEINNRLYNARLERTREEAIKRSKALSDRGKRGADKRWGKNEKE